MNERIRKLREQSLNAVPVISSERAELITEFYKKENGKYSVPVMRAMAFKYILENKELCVNNGELIVGERGPAPKSTPVYPELCVHSENDLDILNNREKIPFKVDADTKRILLQEVLGFWTGRSIRDRIFSEVDDEWKNAYNAGIFTEFMEQRAPGHTVADDKIYHKGMNNIKNDIRESLKLLDSYNDPEAFYKREELKGMLISADAIINYAKRYSSTLYEYALEERNEIRKAELLEMADICTRVPAEPPQNFREALQYYWFIHLGVITELNTWDSFNPGRLDQHLFPFFKRDLDKGTLTKESARELLQSFWIKFNNQPAPPKVGITARESSTYTDFCLINLGGVTAEGENGVNELTYLILDVIQEMRLLQPSSMVQVSKMNPDQFVKRALEIIKTGYGQPSIFNTDAIIEEMLRQGKSLTDARQGGASGCVETGAFGKEAYILTGYFNIPKILEITLNNGFDPVSQMQIGIKSGDPAGFSSFEELFNAFNKQLKYFVNIKIKGSLIIESIYARYMPAPFISLLIDDCISKGRDYNSGGARYNTSYIQGVGLGSVTDSLASLKYNIFDKKRFTVSEMLELLGNNFEDGPKWKQILYATPKYGNDDDYADSIAVKVFDAFFDAVDGRPNARGGQFRINMLPTTCHVYFGSVTGAMPDGRKAYEPLSEGISPVQGMDVKGPTAVIKSASKIDHIKTGGTLLNQKFTPHLLEREEDVDKLVKLIRTYFRLNGHHIQFNVVTADTLKDAKAHPEKYRDLIVRVAGYSDYFVDLCSELQDEIIKRTEHKGV